MPLRARLLAAILASAAAAGCASGGAAGGASPGSPVPTGNAALPEVPATGLQIGWMDYRPPKKRGQIQTLTLVSESTREGKLLRKGGVSMPGGKVVDDLTAAELIQSCIEGGFERFAVPCNPNAPMAGAMQSVWLDRGNGFECLFLHPGAIQNPETKDLPKVFEALKALVFTAHQVTPGSSVTTGQGWSGEDLMNQRPGGGGR
jgi:hypothetical protein